MFLYQQIKPLGRYILYILTVLMVCSMEGKAQSGLTLFVAPDGVAENPGTESLPTTLEGARTLIRALPELPTNGVCVLLRSGTYYRTSSFDLSETDSGTSDRPIIYQAAPGETVRLSGGVSVPATSFTLSSDPRLDVSSIGHVWEVSLEGMVTNTGAVATRASIGWANGYNSSLEPFFNGLPMTLARYPDYAIADAVYSSTSPYIKISGTGLSPDVSGVYTNRGVYNDHPYYQCTIGGVVWSIYCKDGGITYYLSDSSDVPRGNGTESHAWWSQSDNTPLASFAPCSPQEQGTLIGTDGREKIWGFSQVKEVVSATQFTYSDVHFDRFAGETDVYAYGFWRDWWAAQHSSLLNVDSATRTMTINDMAYDPAVRQGFFIYNAPSELTCPGEYYLDEATRTLLVWPPDGVMTGKVVVSTLDEPLLTLTNAHHVTFQGITFEAVIGDGIRIEGGSSNLLQQCIIRNCGNDGIWISGQGNGIDSCELSGTGKSAVQLSGGNRYTLEPGENFVRNCHIHDFARLFWVYQAGVKMDDIADQMMQTANVGNIVEHNHIHHGPHAAIHFRGNEHRICFNDIHDVCEWTSDMGAIYTGRDWGLRGNLIGTNFIHDINSPVGVDQFGVYLDDMASGLSVFGNIFVNASPTYPILLGGGRDNLIENNVMDVHGFALHVDNRAAKSVNTDSEDNLNLLWKIEHFNYQQDPWASAYPALAAIPDDWNQITNTYWLQPEGNTFSRNVSVCSIGQIHTHNYWGPPLLEHFADTSNNLVVSDVEFTDPDAGDYSLTATSSAFTIPGFEDIPFSQIGIISALLPPTVSAGFDPTIVPTNLYVLVGSISGNGHVIESQQWTQISGPSVGLSGTNSLRLTVSNLVEGDYVFRLSATYNTTNSVSDDVAVTVQIPVPAPEVSAGGDQEILLNTTGTVVLTGEIVTNGVSIDAVSWSQINGPTNVDWLATNSLSTTVSNLVEGDYTFRFSVTYNTTNTLSADMMLRLHGAPTILAAVSGDSHITVQWNNVAGAQGYRVHYGTQSGVYTASIDAGSAQQMIVSGLTNETPYYIALNAYDATGETALSSEVSATPMPESTGGAFIQAMDSLVCMEAEHCHTNTPLADHLWQSATNHAGYAGESYMICLPNDGEIIHSDLLASSPRLDYRLLFQEAGTNYVWVRAYSSGWYDDSLHIGLDQTEMPNGMKVSVTHGTLGWNSNTLDGVRISVTVPTPGEHTLNVWMREDGCLLDRIILTTNANYVPTGEGPAESLQTSEAPIIIMPPQDQTVWVGSNVVMTVLATSAEAYQWNKDNVALTSQTGAVLNLPGVGRSDSGLYTVIVSNFMGMVTSDPPARLQVLVPQRLELEQQPDGFQVRFGDEDGSPLDVTNQSAFGVWVSTNLYENNWQPLTNSLIFDNGKFLLFDSETNGPVRFYRVIEH